MNITFILVEPAVPENIGAAARAIKTMGFRNLILVNTTAHLEEKARWLAHGSTELLSNAPVFGSLKEAVDGFDLIIGATAKKRSVKYDYHSPTQLYDLLKSKQKSLKNVAIVFGREESGLTNDELALCQLATRIPMRRKYPSVNLSQSVMVYAYALSSLALKDYSYKKNNTTPAKFAALNSKTVSFLENIGYPSGNIIHNRILERLSLLGDEDINLLFSVLKKLKV